MAGILVEVRRPPKGLERHQVPLVFQPQAGKCTGSIVGVEALSRWDNPRGEVTPSQFVPRAERNNSAIQALTDWTLAAAVAQARAWQDERHQLTVAVNLSPKSALDPGLPTKLQ